MNPANDNLSFLIKYAPKYYTKIEFDIDDFKSNRIMSKIRLTKVVKSVTIHEYEPEKKGILLRALNTKSKLLKKVKGLDADIEKHFPYTTKCQLLIQSISSWQVFSNLLRIESLTIESNPEETESSKALQSLKWRFWSHLPKLTNLKKLQLRLHCQIDPALQDFLTKLATFQPFLSNLKIFSLFINVAEITEMPNFHIEGFYKHITSLQVCELPYDTFNKFFENLELYENLRTLIILQTTDNFSPIEIRTFQKIKTLKHLENLELSLDLSSTRDLEIFLQNFSLPKAINRVQLCFHAVNLSNFISNDNPCENNELFVSFCQKWRDLQNLHTLSLSFFETKNSNPLFEIYLLLAILKNLSRLTSLYFSSWHDSEKHLENVPINFNDIWRSIDHLKPTLKTAYFESPFILIQDLEHEDKSALQTLGLCGTVTGDIKLSNIFKLLKNSLEKSQLILEALLIEKKESLAYILKELYYIPENMNITLNINVKKISQRDFVDVICQGSLKIRHKDNLKLNFSNIPKINSDDFEKTLESLDTNGTLDCVKISDQRGNDLFLGENWEASMQ
jgi:hypothetical protein